MMKIGFLLMLLMLSLNVSAQNDRDSASQDTIPAKFMDDEIRTSFNQFISSVLTYPETKKPLTGSVHVQFVIDTVGNVTDISIIKSLRADYDQALIDTIKQSPKWSPAMFENRPVPFLITYPIFFQK